MKDVIRKEAMKKFDEYFNYCYGNMTVEISKEAERKNCYASRSKVQVFSEHNAKIKNENEYIPLFPLKYTKAYKGRINAYFGKIYICPLNPKQKKEFQKDFDNLKLEGLGINKIKKQMGAKYKVDSKSRKQRKQTKVKDVPREVPKLYKRRRTYPSGIERTRFAIKKNGKEFTIGSCNLEEEVDFEMEFQFLWSRGDTVDSIKKALKKYQLPKGRKPKKEIVAPKKEVSEWDKLTWNERAHLLKDGEDTKIFASDFLDICSIMANGGNGRALASHFSNVEFGTLMFLGENYNTPRFNELYDQGKAVMNNMRGF